MFAQVFLMAILNIIYSVLPVTSRPILMWFACRTCVHTKGLSLLEHGCTKRVCHSRNMDVHKGSVTPRTTCVQTKGLSLLQQHRYT